MRVDVVRPRELGADERDRWSCLLASGPAGGRNAFFAPAFALALDRVRADTRVAVLQDGGRAQGFLGFHDAGDGLALPLGAGLADANGPVLAPGLELDAHELVRRSGLRRWSFDHLLAPDVAWARWQHRVEDAAVVDLADGYEDYLAGLRSRSASLVSTDARKRRRLQREHGLVVLAEERDPAVLAQLRDWKSAQYRRTDQWDRFAQPWIAALLDELLALESAECSGSLVTLRAGGRLVAAHFGLRSGARLAWWFPVYDPECAAFSPGTTLLLGTAELAAGRGLTALDLGRGEEAYKGRFATSYQQVGQGWVPGRAVARSHWALHSTARRCWRRVPEVVKQRVRAGDRVPAGPTPA